MASGDEVNVRIRVTAQIDPDGGQAGWYDRTIQCEDFDDIVLLGQQIGAVLSNPRRPIVPTIYPE